MKSNTQHQRSPLCQICLPQQWKQNIIIQHKHCNNMRANERYIRSCKVMQVKRPYASQDKSVRMRWYPVRSAGDSCQFLRHLESPGCRTISTTRVPKTAKTSKNFHPRRFRPQKLPRTSRLQNNLCYQVILGCLR